MAEKTQTQEKTAPAPRVGVGSKPGKRYFLTQFPELRMTYKPARDEKVGDSAIHHKGEYINFQRMAKPYDYKGRGQLNSEHRDAEAGGEDLGDKNDPPYWGLLVLDGAKPKDAEYIDWLRQHPFYLKTRQDNEPERMPWMKELDWDPTTLLVVKPRKGSHGLEVAAGAPAAAPGVPSGAPTDETPPPTKGRTGLGAPRT